jgi:hypothetical protein
MIAPLFTACATHFDPSVRYIYLGSAQGQMFRLDISHNDEFTWNAIKDVNPISQSMIVIGSIPNKRVKSDVLFYAGESADSQIIAVCI